MPYGIEAFDTVLRPLWKGGCRNMSWAGGGGAGAGVETFGRSEPDTRIFYLRYVGPKP